jgi:TolA-binding protein
MSIFDSIEKLITEHGSAAILSQQLSFAKDQFSDLEGKVSDLQTQVGRLEAQLERERADHKQAREDLQRLKDEHAEEIRIHRFIEFRRGKRTGGKWAAFCPKCHAPVANQDGYIDVICSDRACKWHVRLDDISLSQAIKELEV